MKKYFMFVAVAAAGMLASCSSDSLTAGSDPTIEPTLEERVPIKISVASPKLKGVTRSVGTVGDTLGGTNVWLKEKVKVFMFVKNSNPLTLATDENGSIYDDTELTTPNNVPSGIANEIVAGGDSIKYKYYPSVGNFDFWGYYIDDANNGAIDRGATAYKVPFKIKGCQDLMVAKADTTTAQYDIITDRNSGTPSPWPDQDRFYSAYSARRNVQPDMTFKHLLTRLTFSVVGKDYKAIGWKETVTPGVYALPGSGVYDGVFVKSIKAKSKETGNIIAAYTGDAKPTTELIEFNGDYVMLPLGTKRGERTTNLVDSLYDQTTFSTATWNNKAAMEALLTIGNANWDSIMRPKTIDPTNATPIGGALLVSPEDSYDLEIELGQYLLVEDSYPVPGSNSQYEVRYFKVPYTITPTKVNGTTQGVSYNVKITLFGFEKIEVTTTLEAWTPGEEISFDAE